MEHSRDSERNREDEGKRGVKESKSRREIGSKEKWIKEINRESSELRHVIDSLKAPMRRKEAECIVTIVQILFLSVYGLSYKVYDPIKTS